MTPQSPKRVLRLQIVVACLLFLAFFGQPISALATSQFFNRGCDMEMTDCCLPPVDLGPLADSEEDSCCEVVEEGPTFSEPQDLPACGCRIESAPWPMPIPVALGENGVNAADGSALRWLQIFGSLFGQIQSWQPGECERSETQTGHSGQFGVPGVGADIGIDATLQWHRLERGVAGYLAFLATSRL
jgi:hypothetical protein